MQDCQKIGTLTVLLYLCYHPRKTTINTSSNSNSSKEVTHTRRV
jgi:hypothetical protein